MKLEQKIWVHESVADKPCMFDGQTMHSGKLYPHFVEATLILEINEKKITITENRLKLALNHILGGAPCLVPKIDVARAIKELFEDKQ